MSENVKFAVSDIRIKEIETYDEEEFAVARIGFLSSRPNAHGLQISNEVLLANASTVLGKFLVAKISPITNDAESHDPKEVIYGYFPKEQEIVFVEEDGYLRAYADAVVSKIYGKKFYNIFEDDDTRDVSVEMTVLTENGNDTNDVVESFNIVGVTVLGRSVRPSCPESTIEMIRFSEKATVYFETIKREERRSNMAEEKYVNHPIDESKEAIYEGEWDGEQAKQDLIKEEKYETLAPKVCLRLEEGWKDRQVTKLGYPVMCLNDGKWVYSRKGLASALGYAKQHDDNDIVSKVEAIYKKLGLDSDGKEESAKMSEIEFAAVDIGALWDKLWEALRNRYPYEDYGSWYWIDSIWEEDNRKFAIIRKRDTDELYRLDFSYTEEGLTLAEEIVEIKMEIVETDVIKRFAEPEDISKYQETKCEEVCAKCGKPMAECECEDDSKEDEKDEEKDGEVNAYDLSAQISKLEADIAERDNIIMEKDKELEELRQYRDAKMEEEKAKVVGSVLNSLEDFMDKAEMESCRTEGMACKFSELDAWSNKVKASVVDKALKKGKKSTEFSRIAGPVDLDNKKSKNVWDRI